MKMQRQQGYDCMIYALAMVLDVPAEDIVAHLERVGYSVNPDWSPHIQDLTDVALAYGYAVIEIEPDPLIGNPTTGEVKSLYAVERQVERIKDHMELYQGMLHIKQENGRYHMCAWDTHRVFNPHGYFQDVANLEVVNFYITSKLKSDD